MKRLSCLLALLLAACSESTPGSDAGSPADTDAQVADSGTGQIIDAGEDDAGVLDAGPSRLDQSLADLLASLPEPPTALDAEPAADPALLALGEALFFDPILSGNKDTACASCHQATSASADGLPLALGTGASGRGAQRAEGERPAWARRHSPDLWNRGRLHTLFWDGRVTSSSTTSGPPVPTGVTDPLAVQALHPLLDPTEMLGRPQDTATDGQPNELAGRSPELVYAGLIARLEALPGYVTLFEAAYPGEGVSMQGVLTAIAAFERTRFDASNTPWDQYLRGDLSALNDAAKLGAQVFFGAGKCVQCHSGPMLTDQQLHNVGVPLLDPVDEGAAALAPPGPVFGFRTPPLRNAAASPPFMHNGTMATLQDVLRHYSNPEVTAADYEGEALPEDLRSRIVSTASVTARLVGALSDDLPVASSGSTPVGLSNIRQFLLQLVDEQALQRAMAVPAEVPSGLAVGGL